MLLRYDKSIICYQNDIIIGDILTETQVLFRVDSTVLSELDASITSSGFKTRNEWFRSLVRSFLEDMERKVALKNLEKLKVEGMTEEEIVKMVQAWRKEDH